MKDIGRSVNGLVKVGNEHWRATANEEIPKGQEIEVIEVTGVTLTVKKTGGGS